MGQILTDKDRRASEAERLLSEPLLNEALSKIEADSVNEMLSCHFWQDKKRRMLADRINTVRAFKKHLQSVILTGREANRRTII
jgi:hypothetical protein